LKKRSKKLLNKLCRLELGARSAGQSFLLLFFKKEALPFPSLKRLPAKV
jgi:hypothetical protein